MQNFIDNALKSNAWPFIEAEKILKKINNTTPKKGFVLFETGYGPSGLPHIGTFGEVARTIMVLNAFQKISSIPTKLICFSDDMDGMRGIPSCIQDKQLYQQYMGMPFTSIPDPFSQFESYGHYMNAKLLSFLDHFGFECEFASATDYYKQGRFNDMLLKVLEKYEEIMAVMLPTLGPERQASYSPFMPVCPKTGRVLQTLITDIDKDAGSITYTDSDGQIRNTKVTDGNCKLQWKPDFGMRWAALDVDFEMYGKDHLVNGRIYSKICNILGKQEPHQMFYELFLDAKGEKISKSKGNGFSLEEWLEYAPKESVSLFMYTSPRKAKKLHFDIVPRYVDEYLTHKKVYKKQEQIKQLANPLYHIHGANLPDWNTNITYSLLLKLVTACSTDKEDVIWDYLSSHNQTIKKGQIPFVDQMVHGALNYYRDHIKPNLLFKQPNDIEKKAIKQLAQELEKAPKNSQPEELQNKVYEVGKDNDLPPKEWFQTLYEVLLGSKQGPRFGSFIALYGVEETIELINKKLN